MQNKVNIIKKVVREQLGKIGVLRGLGQRSYSPTQPNTPQQKKKLKLKLKQEIIDIKKKIKQFREKCKNKYNDKKQEYTEYFQRQRTNWSYEYPQILEITKHSFITHTCYILLLSVQYVYLCYWTIIREDPHLADLISISILGVINNHPFFSKIPILYTMVFIMFLFPSFLRASIEDKRTKEQRLSREGEEDLYSDNTRARLSVISLTIFMLLLHVSMNEVLQQLLFGILFILLALWNQDICRSIWRNGEGHPSSAAIATVFYLVQGWIYMAV